MNEGRENEMVEEVVGTDIYDDEELEDQTNVRKLKIIENDYSIQCKNVFKHGTPIQT